MPQLLIPQEINGETIERKCNAALLTYANGYVVLQKNEKDMPQWASTGGKVEQDDQQRVLEFLATLKAAKDAKAPIKLADLTSALDKALFMLADQFHSDPTVMTFAFAALREATEEIGNGSDFFYGSYSSKKAMLVRVDRDNFGIPEANKKFWTEQFYMDFGDMPAEEMMENLCASGENDCTEIVAAPIAEIIVETQGDKTLTTFEDLTVRHSVGVISKRLQALRDRIAETKQLRNDELLDFEFQENDPLLKADLGAGFLRFYLPKDKENKLENWLVILGKRFNGKLKLSTGGAVEVDEDSSFCDAATREVEEEQFGQLPITEGSKCFATDINFKAKSGKPNKDGMLYYSFGTLETDFYEEEINEAIATMNIIAPAYFTLNQLFTDLSKAKPEDLVNFKQRAQDFLALSDQLPEEYAFNDDILAELDNIVNGQSELIGDGFTEFAEENVHKYAEYNYFTSVPYLTYRDAVNQNKPIACVTPSGMQEEVALFGSELDGVKGFLGKFEAAQALMVAQHSLPLQEAANANYKRLTLLAACGIVGLAVAANQIANSKGPSL